MKKIQPFGSWRSPISTDSIVAETVGLGDIVLEEDTSYWIESRPSEGGRNVVVRRDADGTIQDLIPPEFSAVSRVHEYGGGAFTVCANEVFFVNQNDQQIYRQQAGGEPIALTHTPMVRYADLVVDSGRKRLLCVSEDHAAVDEGNEPINQLVAVSLEGAGEVTVLATGADFYASPAVHGEQLAWLSWNHPNLPWDSSELWVAKITVEGGLADPRCIAGGAEESVFQPQWGSDGTLYFVSDRSAWWNLYRWREGRIEPLSPRQAEFGLPQWVFAMSTYALDASDKLYCGFCEQGLWQLASLDLLGGTCESIETPFSAIDGLRCDGGRLVFRAGSPEQASAIVEFDPVSASHRVLRRSSNNDLDAGYFSLPQSIRFPSSDAAEAHAFFYPPTNCDCQAADGERPPLLVTSHGGPTAAATAVLNLSIQYWTSRGFAVLDVNYRGSTGFGRAYHQGLDGAWGVVDVADCVEAARYVIEQGWADAERCAIRGKSAGGYSTLAALVFHDLFRAGACYYGISDLETLAQDTHKFESRYLDRLIGPYPEAREIYRQRSPIHHSERLAAPVIFFQGLEDKVVPPSQAEAMVAVLRDKGIPVAYVPFADERHGFRRAANIKRALEAELYFYSRVFGFELAEPVKPVLIENLFD